MDDDGKTRQDIENIQLVYTALDAKMEALLRFMAANNGRITSLKEIDSPKMSADLNLKVSNFESNIHHQFESLSALLQDGLDDIQTSMKDEVNNHLTHITSVIDTLIVDKIKFLEISIHSQLTDN